MSRRDDRVALRQMLDHAREAREMVRGRVRAHLESDRTFQLALTRLMEIVGESASRVSAPTREAHPAIPWQAVVGMRNRLIHGYDVVDLDLLWDTVETDLPPLIGQLRAIVDDGA